MNSKNPFFWALVGFVIGFVVASAGDVSSPLDSVVGGLLQAGIWFFVSKLILSKKSGR
jgi:hypothetical protein